MAVTIFVDRNGIPDSMSIIDCNDIWFGANKDRIKVDDNIKKLMSLIDGSTYVRDTTMVTRYGEYIDMDYLSTGCKTAINAYANPNKIVDCIESGGNAILQMFRLKNGNLLVEIPPFSFEDYSIDAILVAKGKRIEFTSSSNLEDALMKLGGV